MQFCGRHFIEQQNLNNNILRTTRDSAPKCHLSLIGRNTQWWENVKIHLGLIWYQEEYFGLNLGFGLFIKNNWIKWQHFQLILAKVHRALWQCTWNTIISGQSNVGARWLKHWAAGSWRSSLQYCEMYPLVFHLKSFRFSVTKCCFHVCQSVALITMLLIGHPASKPFGFSHDAHSMQLPRNSFTWITGDRRSDWWKSQTAQILSVGPC